MANKSSPINLQMDLEIVALLATSPPSTTMVARPPFVAKNGTLFDTSLINTTTRTRTQHPIHPTNKTTTTSNVDNDHGIQVPQLSWNNHSTGGHASHHNEESCKERSENDEPIKFHPASATKIWATTNAMKPFPIFKNDESSAPSRTVCQDSPSKRPSSTATATVATTTRARFGAAQVKKWNDKYFQLLNFIDTHGTAVVPLDWTENPALGHWVKRQRSQYKRLVMGKHSPMTMERIVLLERVGFTRDSRQRKQLSTPLASL